MAKNTQGILGGFIGKIGPVTGYMRNTQNILRSSRSEGKVKSTPLRAAQQVRSVSANRLQSRLPIQVF